MEALLRGMYQAIRNPRSHGAYSDDERDAVAIILFVDYLVRVVDRSRTPFSLQSFVERVLEHGFVPKQRYVDLLVKEIPEKQRLAVCREVFAKRGEADGQKCRLFFDTILLGMGDEEKAESWAMVSDELRQTDDQGTIIFVLQAFEGEGWLNLSELARLRIENILLASVAEGRYFRETKRSNPGVLGTWTTRIIDQLSLRDELWRIVIRKLYSDDHAGQDYVLTYLIRHVQGHHDAPPPGLEAAVLKGLKVGDRRFKALVDSWVTLDADLKPLPDAENPWRAPFADAIAAFVETTQAFEIEDDVPF